MEFIVIKLLEMYVKLEEGVRSMDSPQSSGDYSGAIIAGQIGEERACIDLNLSPQANEQTQNNLSSLYNQQENWGYRPDMNFTSYEPTTTWDIPSFGVLDHGGPSGSHHQQELSRQYDFENQLLEALDLTQLPIDDVFTHDLGDAQSQEDDSDYDNNADESEDDTPFLFEVGDDEEEVNVEPEPAREHVPPPPVRPRVYESHVPFHERNIPYLDNLPSTPDVDALAREDDEF